jgi:hypothetical protein
MFDEDTDDEMTPQVPIHTVIKKTTDGVVADLEAPPPILAKEPEVERKVPTYRQL